jgi:pilus assembly protein Flp/PilA
MKLFKKLLKSDAGATAIEYGLIAALVAIASITGMQSLGEGINSTLSMADKNIFIPK